MAIWDFNTINEMVPIEAVLELHGIYPVRGKYRLREDDDTPSASIHPTRKYGNTIHDFGHGNNFTPLSLTMYLQGVDMKEASRILGEAFNIPPISKETDSNKIADYEWRRIGIHPDLVTKNVDFDLEKYGIERSMRFAQRYKMSMSELRDKVIGSKDAAQVDAMDKRQYEYVLRNKAVPYAYELRDEYYRRMHGDFEIAKAVCADFDVDKIFRLHQAEYEELAQELTTIEAIMEKALKGTNVKYKSCSFYAPDDFMDVINGEISFEVGPSSLFDLSSAAYRDKSKVFHCVFTYEEFQRLSYELNKLSERAPEDKLLVAAKRKGDQVTFSFSSKDSGKVNYLVKALRGKELTMSELLDETTSKGMGKESSIQPDFDRKTNSMSAMEHGPMSNV